MADEMINPCPFCGSDDTAATYMESYYLHMVVCRGCGTHGPQSKTKKRAIAAWNGATTRKELDDMERRIEVLENWDD